MTSNLFSIGSFSGSTPIKRAVGTFPKACTRSDFKNATEAQWRSLYQVHMPQRFNHWNHAHLHIISKISVKVCQSLWECGGVPIFREEWTHSRSLRSTRERPRAKEPKALLFRRSRRVGWAMSKVYERGWKMMKDNEKYWHFLKSKVFKLFKVYFSFDIRHSRVLRPPAKVWCLTSLELRNESAWPWMEKPCLTPCKNLRWGREGREDEDTSSKANHFCRRALSLSLFFCTSYLYHI